MFPLCWQPIASWQSVAAIPGMVTLFQFVAASLAATPVMWEMLRGARKGSRDSRCFRKMKKIKNMSTQSVASFNSSLWKPSKPGDGQRLPARALLECIVAHQFLGFLGPKGEEPVPESFHTGLDEMVDRHATGVAVFPRGLFELLELITKDDCLSFDNYCGMCHNFPLGL